MPDTIKISELDEALALADAAEFPYSQENGGERTTFKAPLTQIAAKIVEDMSYAGINLPAGAGVKSVENTLNYLLGAVGGNPNENIATEYDPTETYAKGDYCIYENVLYVCTASNGTTGTFDPTAWSQTELAEQIGNLSALTTTDKSSLVKAINAIDNALDMTDTASGAIATFDTSLALPLQDCTIAINAVQEGSGTPSPDNVRPITGFTGANIKVAGSNLWDEETEIGGISWTTGVNSGENDRLRSKNYIPVLPNTAYYMASPQVPRFVWLYDANKNIIEHVSGNNNCLQLSPSAHTFTTPDNAYYCRFIIWTTYGTTYNNDISINYPSTDTDYHAYNGTTTAITWQSEAGTVYGGSLDVTSGKLTVTWGVILDLGSLAWGGSNGVFNFNYSVIPQGWTRANSDWGRCENLIVENWNSVDTGTYSDNSIHGLAYNQRFILRVYASSCNTVADLQTLLNGKKLIYKTTPTTVQLTPTQITAIVGTNNVFTDTNGDTTLEYYTKRGEQTAHIAEGVAVDVINNKSIDTLTTTNKTLVGAVNEVDGGKVNVSDLTPKTFSTLSPISIQANETITQQFTVNNAKYGIITGFAITSNLNVVASQFYFYNATTVQVRVKNVSNVNDVFHISFFYI